MKTLSTAALLTIEITGCEVRKRLDVTGELFVQKTSMSRRE